MVMKVIFLKWYYITFHCSTGSVEKEGHLGIDSRQVDCFRMHYTDGTMSNIEPANKDELKPLSNF